MCRIPPRFCVRSPPFSCQIPPRCRVGIGALCANGGGSDTGTVCQIPPRVRLSVSDPPPCQFHGVEGEGRGPIPYEGNTGLRGLHAGLIGFIKDEQSPTEHIQRFKSLYIHIYYKVLGFKIPIGYLEKHGFHWVDKILVPKIPFGYLENQCLPLVYKILGSKITLGYLGKQCCPLVL